VQDIVFEIQKEKIEKAGADWLHGQGVGRGVRLGFRSTNGMEHVTLFSACARLLGAFVPLNFRLGASELSAQLALIEPAVLLIAQPSACEYRAVYDIDQVAFGEAASFPRIPADPDDTMLMLFTSGSTGTPKGVMLHARMLQQNMINTQLGWGLLNDDISVIHTPFFHTGGYNVTCLPLLRLGGCLVLTDRFDAGDMLKIIEEEQVSVFFAVPTMFRMMLESSRFETTDFSRLRFCISGGAPCPLSLIEAWRAHGVPLMQGFGLTEVGPNCFAMTAEEAANRPDSVGRPMLHSHMKLLDESGAEVAAGAIGELWIAGEHVCRGYWRADEAFAQVFREGYFHTGDLMRQDEQGFFYVAGRLKDMYISGGENVFPGEVARCLLRHPDISDAVVIPVPDATWGEVGFAFLRTARNLDLAELRTFLAPLLSRYKHPRHLCTLPAFPLLPNGKVDMAALHELARRKVTHG